MSDALLRVYHALPGPLRSLAASLRGFQLRRWRYGPETDGMVTQALERECWSKERWNAWRGERLARLLHTAATEVPYYREMWSKRRRRGNRSDWEDLENWPILEKEPLRENPRSFVADDLDVRRMFHLHTSGTSGKPLDIWAARSSLRTWYALFEARCRRWNGLSRHDRWAVLGGQLVAPVGQRHPPFWVWNAALSQLYMSSYHLAPALIPYYLEALCRYRVSYLCGYTSSLYSLALEALRLNQRDLQLAVVLTYAEPLFDFQRKTISEAFGCPVRETYGMAEMVAGASECEAGVLHLWPEVSVTEVLATQGRAAEESVGEILCTGLLNGDMPLIRYRVGDRGTLRVESGGVCGCGRTLPVLHALEGRVDEVLYTRDGRRIGRLDPVFKGRLPVREAQIIQETLDLVRVRYVAAPNFTAAAGQSIIERLQARMGPVQVVLEEVREIPRAANGKFRAVISHVGATRQDG